MKQTQKDKLLAQARGHLRRGDVKASAKAINAANVCPAKYKTSINILDVDNIVELGITSDVSLELAWQHSLLKAAVYFKTERVSVIRNGRNELGFHTFICSRNRVTEGAKREIQAQRDAKSDSDKMDDLIANLTDKQKAKLLKQILSR